MGEHMVTVEIPPAIAFVKHWPTAQHQSDTGIRVASALPTTRP